ncbi:aldehyde dehydrogenase [Aneurinibacillus aneurinilyticus]|jgi:aminomuconate-semialdehyde/2-hydroxymuconate-6-semialdehyde dehydrogenase|uniref:Putative 5-carboxymethyl-2-hydroxymuconate semialdehyde dehydrogenase n=1 Tax=Aneurinibacillus aneurinilyticus ATCC 12856 TaxID=649747 RepID=U1YI25_ANEAE|nr:aldehyde dehydrogenase [Aneurinibacillus aneurinilyticus]ERI10436.1 putative 5-carboxymethyl-2-hydroxymuconate semialdehyde dehydrogenase [Aneurinibacillus aneurinilyticus ATCC 12856]MED0709020.1 aldehyde dehydrogenase [Aneurinibacillus aneurinilyticus]MED0725414.1 aldehyde dehydrogenase [Aneurinibacillus aneurinilyticus]MED0730725.1 aldehyde dehydrogenase [Aneurinibacillus aneurinilyticus]MED0740931.1 aldehyde dehydrogenase [Aneurinibacillus aneurinilyticus]
MQTQARVERIKTKPIDCLHFIDGKYVPSKNGKTFTNINPATEQIMGTVAEGGKEEIDLAVAAAKRAFEGSWRRMPAGERARIIRRIGDIILERKDELAALESFDTGKPYGLASNIDIPRAAYNFHFFADYMASVGTEAYQMDDVALNYAIRRPLGVVGLINPWNLPLLLMTWKLAPCLAAGNTAVLKPAEWTPMTATLLGEICKEAGVPNGVVNIVHGFGPDSAGAALTEHPDVSAISFTGETTTGKHIMTAAAKTLKRLSYELGGKNPNIIFADADLDEVIETTIKSSFINQGEVCLCGSRIYVERALYDAFVEKFTAKTKELIVGDPLDPNTTVGTLISEEHYRRVRSYVELAVEEGGVIETGGKRPEHLSVGYYLEPTIITGLANDCRVVQEEIFGPVVTILPFDREEEVIKQANDTHYGLSATIWTNDLRRAHRVAAQIEAGIIWVNTWFLRDLRTPFGGMKQSGIGREGGMHSFEFYSELSNVCIKL